MKTTYCGRLLLRSILLECDHYCKVDVVSVVAFYVYINISFSSFA